MSSNTVEIAQPPTREQLAALLQQVNVERVAAEAQLSTKTIYRLRHAKTVPRLDVVHRLLGALERIALEDKGAGAEQ